jgi:hypothetical protein
MTRTRAFNRGGRNRDTASTERPQDGAVEEIAEDDLSGRESHHGGQDQYEKGVFNQRRRP